MSEKNGSINNINVSMEIRKWSSTYDSRISNRRNSKAKHWMTIFCGFIASIGGFCNGTFIGWSAHAISTLETSNMSVMYTAREISYIASILALGAAISPFLIYKIWNKFGTKICILIGCGLMLSSWTLLSIETECFWIMLTGRFIGGLSVGIIHFLVPIYIHDISTNEQKSTLHYIFLTQYAFGILMQFLLGLLEEIFISNSLSVIAPIVFMISFLLIPESPRFLCLIGKIENAKLVLNKFMDINENVEETIFAWSNENLKEIDLKFLVMNSSHKIRKFLPMIGFIIFDQLIGAIPMLFFIKKIFYLTGGNYTENIQLILCAVVFLVAIPLPSILGFRLENKPTLFWTTICMSTALGILGIYCHYQGTYGHTDNYKQTPLITICAFYFFYAIGPFRLLWICVDKIIPRDHFVIVKCFLTSISWLTMFSITRVLTFLINNIGVGWLCWNISIFCLFATIFITIFIPKFNEIPMEEEKLYPVIAERDDFLLKTK